MTGEGEPVLSDEAVENLYNQMYDLYLENALEERGLDESELQKAQILFINPFKDGQFDDISAGDSDVEVRINDEAEVILEIELDADREIEKGDPIRWGDISDFGEVVEIPDFGTDVGHITFIWLPDGHLYTYFDFLYNKSYLRPVLEAADEFIELTEYCRENELWRGFIENAFHASERLMKHRVIMHGKPAYDHRVIQSQYRIFANSEIEENLYDQYNQLKDKYRMPGSYVNPGDHPEGVNEKEFDLDESVADEILDAITEYRASLGIDTSE